MLATTFAALELQCNYTRSRLAKGSRYVSALRQRSILHKWHHSMMNARKLRYSKMERAKRSGNRLSLKIAMQTWRSGAIVSRKAREMDLLIEAKRKQIHEWLEERRY